MSENQKYYVAYFNAFNFDGANYTENKAFITKEWEKVEWALVGNFWRERVDEKQIMCEIDECENGIDSIIESFELDKSSSDYIRENFVDNDNDDNNLYLTSKFPLSLFVAFWNSAAYIHEYKLSRFYINSEIKTQEQIDLSCLSNEILCSMWRKFLLLVNGIQLPLLQSADSQNFSVIVNDGEIVDITENSLVNELTCSLDYF